MTDEISFDPEATPLSGRRRVALWTSLGLVGAGVLAAGLVSQVGSHQTVPPTAASAVLAAASSLAPAPSASAGSIPAPKRDGAGKAVRPGDRRPGAFGRVGRLGGAGAAGGRTLHSEATVATANGGTKILDTQAGKITAVSGSSITVTSTDKVAFTYTVSSTTKLRVFPLVAVPKGSPAPKATVTDLKVGDTVNVTATRAGDVRTATSVVDGVPARAIRGGGAHPAGPRPSGSASPAPAAGAATT